MRLSTVDEEPGPNGTPAETHATPPELPLAQRGIEGTPSRWLALAFAALLSILVLLGTTGVGAAASTLLGGPPIVCGGP